MLRFDSAACFAVLLGTPDHGRWLIAPEGEVKAVRRRYRDHTAILETESETADGVAAVIDFMPARTRTRTSSGSSKAARASLSGL